MEVRMMSNDGGIKLAVAVVVMMVVISGVESLTRADYGEALSKSILFFEGQRSGKLPPMQRMKWRKDSALTDGYQIGVDLTGGYYDAGDNVKYNFPMAFSMTMLAWSVIEFGKPMGAEKANAMDAIRWGTDYLLKSTNISGLVFVQVGDPYEDHFCWERSEDMDTVRTPYAVSRQFPGSEVAAEIAAALAASSLVFKQPDPNYSALLLDRAIKVFKFADKYRGSYNDVLGPWVCPFYCDFSGYEDELLWAAAWLFKATRNPKYWKYLDQNMSKLDISKLYEFGWDSKHAGINVLMSKTVPPKNMDSSVFKKNAEKFICSVLPESSTKAVNYSSGGLLFKPGNSNLQHATTLSFLLITYTRHRFNGTIHCDNMPPVSPTRLIQIAQNQVDYILGDNPLKMSYMVGYGSKYPQKIHHRGSTLPSMDQHPQKIECQGGSSYFYSTNPNLNVLTGAIVGGPDINDNYDDNRSDFVHTEPTTYINAPFVGVLAYFKSHPSLLN